MWRKDCRAICNLLKRIHKTGVILSIVLFNMTLVACSSKNSAVQISNNSKSQEYEETEEIKQTEVTKQTVETEATEPIEQSEETEPTKTQDGEIDELNEKVEISMEEAIDIGAIEADKYYDDLKLTEVHSYDNDYKPTIVAGSDGEREWWYVNFGNEDLNYVNILIRNGEIVAVENYDENGNNGLLDLSKIQLTSQEAAEKAKELGLQGGNPDKEEDWVSGYNFKLSFSSLVKNPKDIRIFLEVIGISSNGNFAHVDFDAVTGELLLAEEKIEYEDGTFEWKSFQ